MPWAGVGDGDDHLAVHARRRNVDAAAGGSELDRVREEIEDDLAHAPLVAVDEVDVGGPRERELDAVPGRPLAHHDDAALECLTEREVGELELDLSGLDLRQVEHVVDQRQQMVAGREDVFEVLLAASR